MKRKTILALCGALLAGLAVSGCVFEDGGYGRHRGGWHHEGGWHRSHHW